MKHDVEEKNVENVMSWGLSTYISQVNTFHNFQWLLGRFNIS